MKIRDLINDRTKIYRKIGEKRDRILIILDQANLCVLTMCPIKEGELNLDVCPYDMCLYGYHRIDTNAVVCSRSIYKLMSESAHKAMLMKANIK